MSASSKQLILVLIFALLAISASCWEASSSEHWNVGARRSQELVELDSEPTQVPTAPDTQPIASDPVSGPSSSSSNPVTLESPLSSAPSSTTAPAAEPQVHSQPSSPSSAPRTLPPFLLTPAYGFNCIGAAPNELFTCEEGIWTAQKSLVIGVGGDALTLNVSGPSYIPGDLTILDGAKFYIYPPILSYLAPNSTWRLERSLITVSNCFNTSSPPELVFGYNASMALFRKYTESETLTIAGIDSRCNSGNASVSWNLRYNDKQPVDTDLYCFTPIVQYRTFPSESEPDRFQMRMRFQWKFPCLNKPPTKKGPSSLAVVFIAFGSTGAFVVIFFITLCCITEGKDCCKLNGSGSSSNHGSGSNYHAMSNHHHNHSHSNNNNRGGMGFSGGGGGGGGGGFQSSSAGSWN